MAVCCALELRRNISSRQISICLILFFSFSPTGSGAHPPPPAERGRMAVGSETDTNCLTPAELHTHATRGGCINRPAWKPASPAPGAALLGQHARGVVSFRLGTSQV